MMFEPDRPDSPGMHGFRDTVSQKEEHTHLAVSSGISLQVKGPLTCNCHEAKHWNLSIHQTERGDYDGAKAAARSHRPVRPYATVRRLPVWRRSEVFENGMFAHEAPEVLS